MKNYELSLIFHPDLEMNFEPALDKVKQIIKSANGTITKEENDGKKRLAYPIKGQEYGIYYYMNVELPSDGPNKISGVFNITDEVIRHLLVAEDEKKAKLAARKAERDNSRTRTGKSAEDAAEDNTEEKEA